MALATNSSTGEIHLSGDFSHVADAYNPELTPTGVVPGDYLITALVVDQKGRTLYMRSIVEADAPIASTSVTGIAQFGTNITDGGSGLFSVATAANDTLGVAKSANTNHITITAGAVDVGTQVVLTDEAQSFSKGQHFTVSVLSGPTFTPDLNVSNIFSVATVSGATLAAPSNAQIGDKFHVIITGANVISYASQYKLRSTPTTNTGTCVLSCIKVASDKIYCILQRNFL